MAATTFPNPTPAGGLDRFDRLSHIDQARQAILYDRLPRSQTPPAVHSWIEQSWRRCLAQGRRPEQAPAFDLVHRSRLAEALDTSRHLLKVARPVLERLGSAIADTRYFAILTNAEGIVIDVNGRIDRSDRRADLVTRLGTDLSEQQVGTTAIGAALAALTPVWLHRGEHFFDATSVYSCAGAPLFGPDGRCIGMLDLTGIEAAERPELRHLVTQSARSIANALVAAQPHALLLRLNWPGQAMGDDGDGLVCLDADGGITGANQAARELLPQLANLSQAGHPALQFGDLFALPFEQMFDSARRRRAGDAPLDVPLWTGLRLQALALLPGQPSTRAPLDLGALTAPGAKPSTRPLHDLETALIRKAVDDARGNVLEAARALGVSRATVYRRLSPAARR